MIDAGRIDTGHANGANISQPECAIPGGRGGSQCVLPTSLIQLARHWLTSLGGRFFGGCYA